MENSKTHLRIPVIDLFRGTVIALMILANFFHYFDRIPGWLKHAAPLKGLNLIDLGAPVFFFILGIAYALSLENRLLTGGPFRTIVHLVLRYGTLWLFGYLGVLILSFNLVFGWNVLMALGFSGLIALPFMLLKPYCRMGVGILLLLVYQFIILRIFSDSILKTDMGGYFASLSWGGLILLASWWWPLIKEGNVKKINLHGIAVTLISLAAAFAVSLISPINKPFVSMSYILISYAVSVAALVLFINVERFYPHRFLELKIIGKNPLFLYMVHGVIVELSKSILPPSLNGTVVILLGLMLLFLCFMIAYNLDRKKIYIKL